MTEYMTPAQLRDHIRNNQVHAPFVKDSDIRINLEKGVATWENDHGSGKWVYREDGVQVVTGAEFGKANP